MIRNIPNEDMIERLTADLLQTVDEFAETNRLTTGDAMGALFSAFVASAKGSPQYDPKRLVAEMDEKIREAVGLQ
jgi:hypothetical protein